MTTTSGLEMIQITVGVPIAVIHILEGAILFFLLAGDLMMQYRMVFKMEITEIPEAPEMPKED